MSNAWSRDDREEWILITEMIYQNVIEEAHNCIKMHLNILETFHEERTCVSSPFTDRQRVRRGTIVIGTDYDIEPVL